MPRPKMRSITVIITVYAPLCHLLRLFGTIPRQDRSDGHTIPSPAASHVGKRVRKSEGRQTYASV